MSQTRPRAPPVRGSRGRSKERIVPWEDRWCRRRGEGVSGLKWVMRIAVGWGVDVDEGSFWGSLEDDEKSFWEGDEGASGFC